MRRALWKPKAAASARQQTFRMLVTFDVQADGKTVLTLRQMHPTRDRREAGIGFGAVEFGYQTLDKLADHLAARR
jgi:hypothetical protein